MFSVSACVDMKKSRLLSWPMYFWYRRGAPPVERSVGFDFRMYQSARRSLPSGLAWTNRMMTLSRIRIVSGSVRLTIW